MSALLQNFVELFIESAPWLLLGFVVAGIIKGVFPQDLLTRHLGGRGHKSTVKAAVIGAPLPLCSCGVVPAALGLRKAGASKNATVSFLVATPETGVDSIAVTYALMGPLMAVIRPVAAIFSGILSGLLVGNADSRQTKQTSTQTERASTQSSSCCASKPETPKVSACCSPQNDAKLQAKSEASCCATEAKAKAAASCCGKPKPATTGFHKLKNGLQFSFNDMLKDIALWLIVGLLFAAAVKTWVPASFLSQWGDGFLAFVVMALIGVPMYICATASTPIAAGLLLSGVSPGAVLVFMMAGPATNVGTLGIIAKEMGKKTLVAYLSGVLIASFLFGYLTNLLVTYAEIDVLSQAGHTHAHEPSLVGTLSALVLACFLGRVLWRSYVRPLLPNKTASTGCH